MINISFSSIILWTLLIINLIWISEQNSAVIKQVNVLFRHGDRTPIIEYPLIPYSAKHFFPAGAQELTNRGKQRSYELGEMLRNMYDDFLGSIYKSDDVTAISTDYDRTKMSLQLVLAGLYPPGLHQKWNPHLNWQPIPTHYRPMSEDYLFQPTRHCKLYEDEVERIMKSPEGKAQMSYYENLAKTMTNLTGYLMDHSDKLARLYTDLECLDAMGFKLPNRMYDYFPTGPLMDAILTSLRIINFNDVLKRLSGGKFIRQMLENMLIATNSSQNVEKRSKIYLYSGHDLNIASLLEAFNSTESRLSKFTSALITELLYIDGHYYVKVFYYLGIPPTMKELQIFNCQNPCPMEDFQYLTKHVTPSDEEFKCV